MNRTLTAGTYWIHKETNEIYFIASVRYPERKTFEVFIQFVNVRNGCRWSEPVETQNSDDITKDEFAELCKGQVDKFVEIEVELKVVKNPKYAN